MLPCPKTVPSPSSETMVSRYKNEFEQICKEIDKDVIVNDEKIETLSHNLSVDTSEGTISENGAISPPIRPPPPVPSAPLPDEDEEKCQQNTQKMNLNNKEHVSKMKDESPTMSKSQDMLNCRATVLFGEPPDIHDDISSLEEEFDKLLSGYSTSKNTKQKSKDNMADEPCVKPEVAMQSVEKEFDRLLFELGESPRRKRKPNSNGKSENVVDSENSSINYDSLEKTSDSTEAIKMPVEVNIMSDEKKISLRKGDVLNSPKSSSNHPIKYPPPLPPGIRTSEQSSPRTPRKSEPKSPRSPFLPSPVAPSRKKKRAPPTPTSPQRSPIKMLSSPILMQPGNADEQRKQSNVHSAANTELRIHKGTAEIKSEDELDIHVLDDDNDLLGEIMSSLNTSAVSAFSFEENKDKTVSENDFEKNKEDTLNNNLEKISARTPSPSKTKNIESDTEENDTVTFRPVPARRVRTPRKMEESYIVNTCVIEQTVPTQTIPPETYSYKSNTKKSVYDTMSELSKLDSKKVQKSKVLDEIQHELDKDYETFNSDNNERYDSSGVFSEEEINSELSKEKKKPQVRPRLSKMIRTGSTDSELSDRSSNIQDTKYKEPDEKNNDCKVLDRDSGVSSEMSISVLTSVKFSRLTGDCKSLSSDADSHASHHSSVVSDNDLRGLVQSYGSIPSDSESHTDIVSDSEKSLVPSTDEVSGSITDSLPSLVESDLPDTKLSDRPVMAVKPVQKNNLQLESELIQTIISVSANEPLPVPPPRRRRKPKTDEVHGAMENVRINNSQNVANINLGPDVCEIHKSQSERIETASKNEQFQLKKQQQKYEVREMPQQAPQSPVRKCRIPVDTSGVKRRQKANRAPPPPALRQSMPPVPEDSVSNANSNKDKRKSMPSVSAAVLVERSQMRLSMSPTPSSGSDHNRFSFSKK